MIFTPEQLEECAQKLFDQGPFNHPNGNVPKWENQPSEIKAAFREKARQLYAMLR